MLALRRADAASVSAILHLTDKKMWKIKGENKSVPHCDSGLTLARMTSAVVSNRKHKPKSAGALLPSPGSADRALAASHLPLADARAMGRSSRPTGGRRVEPGHDGEGGGTPPPCFLQTNGNFAPSPPHLVVLLPLRGGRRERGDGFCENNSKAILSPDQRLKGGRAECWARHPHPNPLPPKGARGATGIPHPNSQRFEWELSRQVGGGKRGFSQNK